MATVGELVEEGWRNGIGEWEDDAPLGVLRALGIWDAEVMEGYTAFHGAFKGVVFLDLAEWPPEMPKGTAVRVVLLPKEEK